MLLPHSTDGFDDSLDNAITNTTFSLTTKTDLAYHWIFISLGLQLVPGNPTREPADVDGDCDVDVQQRPPELHHVPAHQPDEDQERQRPDADDR